MSLPEGDALYSSWSEALNYTPTVDIPPPAPQAGMIDCEFHGMRETVQWGYGDSYTSARLCFECYARAMVSSVRLYQDRLRLIGEEEE